MASSAPPSAYVHGVHSCCAATGSADGSGWAGTVYCSIIDRFDIQPGSRATELTRWPRHSDETMLDVSVFQPVLVPRDIAYIVAFAVLLSVARIVIQRVFRAVAESGCVRLVVAKKDKDLGEVRSKFSESGYKIVFYTLSMTWSWFLVLKYDYFNNLDALWSRNVHHRTEPRVDLWVFNLFQLGAYVAMLFFHVVVDVQRADYWAMFIHHVATIFLLVLSKALGALDPGVIIVAVHDVNDVLLELAKTQVYMGYEALANVLFGAFVLAWMYFRLWLYPVVIVQSTIWDSAAVMGCYPWYMFHSLLNSTLLILHVYWFILILKVLASILRGDTPADVRENNDATTDDDDGNETTTTAATKKKKKKRSSSKKRD